MTAPERVPDRAPVAVVIVSWNSAGWLPACLASLDRQTRPPAEIVVVDNASSDRSAAVVAGDFPHVRLLASSTNLGFCEANNRGIDLTESPFVLALNPDTELAPTFLEELLPAFEDPAVGIACGKLLRFDGRTIDSAGQQLAPSRQPRDRGYGRLDDGRYDTDAEVFGACGAGALYRRTLLASIRDEGGYFDREFFAFYEDLDLAWRARRMGWRAVYRHRAVGYHGRGGSADRQHPLARFAGSLKRNPTVQAHIIKNRYLTILRNDSPSGYVRNVPAIWLRDLAMLLLVLRRPGILARLWRHRALFARAVRLRRLDAERIRHQVGPGKSVTSELRSSGSG